MPDCTEHTVMADNPSYRGMRVRDIDDCFANGFAGEHLGRIYASLAGDAHEFGLLLESPQFEEVDSYFNPGTDPVSDAMVLEAITIDRFSRTEKRMAAVVRVLNRHLAESTITALDPVVGTPKKTGAFAYVTVQLPFSDGQTVSVIFHAPEADRKRIGPSDTIIAFRWLLNKRDITQVVAPEEGTEISLESIAKRITQLVVKNSARFEKQQKGAQEERKELDSTREALKQAEATQAELMDAVASKRHEADTVAARLSAALAALEGQKTYNAELEAKIATLKAQQRHNAAKSTSTAQAEELGRQAFAAKKENDPLEDNALEALVKTLPLSQWNAVNAAWKKGYQSAMQGQDSGSATPEFETLLKEAARWRGAVMQVARMVKGNKKDALAVMKMTTKGDLDAYLMRKFGISNTDARDVSNTLTSRNIPADMTATLEDYMSEPWAKFARTGGGGQHAGDGPGTSGSDTKRPERQEAPFAAFLDAYSGKTSNPYLLTSEMSDAFILGQYFARQGYERPKMIAKSRGDSWRVVMNSADTTNYVEAVFNVTDNVVKPKSGPSPRMDSDTYSIGALEKKISTLMAEVAAKGIVVPSPSEFMDDVNSGRRLGKSKLATVQSLKEYKQDLSGLKAGTVTARKILGAGGKKDMAEAWLLVAIDGCYTALEDGTGFRCTTNMGNYAGMLNDALAGKDISALTDKQVDETQLQRDRDAQKSAAEMQELEKKANQLKSYVVGKRESMKEPLEVSFTIQSDATRTIVELGELVTPQAKYEFLRDKAQSATSLVKMDNLQFNRQVDLNSAIRKGITFGHFKIEPRTGYCVATCTIDLSGVPEAVGGKSTDILPATITTTATPFQGRSVPWIVMNAPRPIRGHETQEGEFIHGRYFAAIDTSKDDAGAMLEENRKLDAKIIESVDMETAVKIGLTQMPDGYREQTEKLLSGASADAPAVGMVLDKIPSTITHGQATELIEKARSMPSPFISSRGASPTPPPAEQAFVVTLRDILSGKYDGDTARMGALLDEAAAQAEKVGVMGDHEALFNQVADYLTAMLKKRAA